MTDGIRKIMRIDKVGKVNAIESREDNQMKKKTESLELPEFLTKKQVATYLSCCTKTVDRMFTDGLGSVKLRGRRYVTKAQLSDYINKNIQTA
jgi:hypothetical protein